MQRVRNRQPKGKALGSGGSPSTGALATMRRCPGSGTESSRAYVTSRSSNRTVISPIEKTALIRIRAGISHALAEAMDEGHCGLPADELVPLVEKLLEAPAALVETALDLELGDGTVVAAEVNERRVIFLAGLYRAERGIAERLAAIAAAPSPWPAIDPAKAIPWVEQRAGIVLADSQRAAVSVALANKVLVITGGPGVGKTTIVNAILKILAAKGARALNLALQQALNPEPVQKVERFGWRFAPGDKVMQIDNDYEKEVYNGDLGRVVAIDEEIPSRIAI
jgi:ATP-dependent exoDNAse (exonuclease V) alpha subunit